MEPILNPYNDLHLHTRYSDGKATVDQMVETAIEKGMTKIAITDHMPLPYPNRYTMKPENLLAFRDAVKRAQDRYSDRIEILLGLEMEVIPSLAFWTDRIISLGWDWLIASVHALEEKGQRSLVNGNAEEFDVTLNQMFGGRMDRLVESYFKSLRHMVSMGAFQVIGHLDVIRKHMSHVQPDMEYETLYKDLVKDILDRAEKTGIFVEINTGGMTHPPGIFTLTNPLFGVHETENSLVMSSDAHNPAEIRRYYDHVLAQFDLMPNPSSHDSGSIAAAG